MATMATPHSANNSTQYRFAKRGAAKTPHARPMNALPATFATSPSAPNHHIACNAPMATNTAIDRTLMRPPT